MKLLAVSNEFQTCSGVFRDSIWFFSESHSKPISGTFCNLASFLHVTLGFSLGAIF